MARFYCIYETATGNIRQWGVVGDGEDAGIAPGDGRAAVIGLDDQVNPATHYVAAGMVVAYTTEQATGKSIRPSMAHAWSNATMQWEDSRSLDQAKANRIELIRQARESSVNGTFVWDGSTFDADTVSQMRILGAAVAATKPGFEPVAWRLSDGSWRTLSATDVGNVFDALQIHLRAQFNTFATLSADIQAATSVPDVDLIDWD